MEAKTELQQIAVRDARRKELEFIQRAMDIQWLNSRMEDGRMGRCLALIQREAEMEKDFQERTDHAAIVNARADKETKLGIEIAKVEREQANKLFRRHYLWDRDPGLRELSRKLQAGYVCRDLKQQILHNEYKRLQEKAEERYANAVLLKAISNDQEAREQEELAKIKRNTEYCADLQQQLVNRQRVKQCQYEDTLIEKKMLDDIMRTIADEDQRELQHKREQTDKLRREMVMSAQARAAWREKQKQMVVIEERQIEEQKKAVSDRSSAIVAAREEKMRQKDEANARIAAKVLADEAVRQDRENIIKLLQEQECLEKNCQDDIAKAEKLERVRIDTKSALTSQMETKKRLVEEQKKRELEFRKDSEAKMKVDDEKEREKQRKIKEKNRQYTAELLKQIEENARRRKREEEIENQRAQQVWDSYDACYVVHRRPSVDDEKEREKRWKIREKNRKYTAELLKQIEENARRRKREEEIENQRAQQVWDSYDACYVVHRRPSVDDEKEREKRWKIREKNRKYTAELLKQIEENARRRKREEEIENQRAQQVWDSYDAWGKEVAEERKKIVEEHAPHLLGYLQAGVLKPHDMPQVRKGADKHEQLKSLDVEGLTQPRGRPKRHSKCNAQCRILREF